MNGVICSITNLQTRILTSLKKRVYTFLHGWVNANSIYYRFVIVEQLQKYIKYKVEFPQGMIICILTTPSYHTHMETNHYIIPHSYEY